MNKEQECARLTRMLDLKSGIDPWKNANDDLLILEHFRDLTPDEFDDYKDCLYHETRGHATHTVWNYRKGKFANAAIMWLNRSS